MCALRMLSETDASGWRGRCVHLDAIRDRCTKTEGAEALENPLAAVRSESKKSYVST